MENAGILFVEDDAMLAEAVRTGLEQQGRIFSRFYRVAGSAERESGIGLSLVSRIAQLHEASIGVSEGIGGRGFAVTVHFTRKSK